MRNWRTTIAGFIAGAYPIIDALIQAYTSGYFTDKTGGQLWAGIGFIIIGFLCKDHNVSGSKTPEKFADDTNETIVGDRPKDR